MIAPLHSSTSQQSAISPEFGTSADGFPVARIGETLLALLPTRDGSFFLASAWRNFRPFEELRRDHFYGHDGRVENEAAFRDRVFETLGHMGELAGLCRVQTQIAASTPWGGSQFAMVYADGVGTRNGRLSQPPSLHSSRPMNAAARTRPSGTPGRNSGRGSMVARSAPESRCRRTAPSSNDFMLVTGP